MSNAQKLLDEVVLSESELADANISKILNKTKVYDLNNTQEVQKHGRTNN